MFKSKASEVQQQRNESRSCNEEVLFDIGFSRVGSSSLYKNEAGALILSPGISKGQHEKYWFDIRDANIQKMSSNTNAWILLRIVPSWFAFFSIANIREHLNEKTQDIRKNSGLVYGFYCELNEKDRLIDVTAKNDRSASFSITLVDYTSIKQTLCSTMKI